MGEAIYLHGACVTIGCIPIIDEYIKEIYVLAVQAKQNGQSHLPIYIFPLRFIEANKTKLYMQYSTLESFWKTLEVGYDLFKQHHNKALGIGSYPKGTCKVSVK